MKRMFRTSAIAVSVLAAALAATPGAWADGGRHYSDRQGHGQYYRHNDRHYGHKGYYRDYRHGYKGHYKHHDDDDGEKLLIGLLVGGLVGYAIGNQPPSYDSGPSYYAPATSQPRVEAYPAPQYSYGEPAGTCLQEREYQTKVIVGGKQVDAYGTACLQPDGSWRRGPAQLVSY